MSIMSLLSQLRCIQANNPELIEEATHVIELLSKEATPDALLQRAASRTKFITRRAHCTLNAPGITRPLIEGIVDMYMESQHTKAFKAGIPLDIDYKIEKAFKDLALTCQSELTKFVFDPKNASNINWSTLGLEAHPFIMREDTVPNLDLWSFEDSSDEEVSESDIEDPLWQESVLLDQPLLEDTKIDPEQVLAVRSDLDDHLAQMLKNCPTYVCDIFLAMSGYQVEGEVFNLTYNSLDLMKGLRGPLQEILDDVESTILDSLQDAVKNGVESELAKSCAEIDFEAVLGYAHEIKELPKFGLQTKILKEIETYRKSVESFLGKCDLTSVAKLKSLCAQTASKIREAREEIASPHISQVCQYLAESLEYCQHELDMVEKNFVDLV